MRISLDDRRYESLERIRNEVQTSEIEALRRELKELREQNERLRRLLTHPAPVLVPALRTLKTK